MSGRVIEAAVSPNWQRFCGTSLTVSSATSYASGGTLTAAPSGDNVFYIGDPNGTIPNGAMLRPFGRGDDGDTVTLLIYGWKPARNNTPLPSTNTGQLWLRTTLYSIVCTLEADYSNTAGASGYPVATGDIFCGTITMSAGFGVENVDYYFQGQPREIYIDTKSSSYLSVERSAGAATQANLLIQMV